MIDVVSPEVRSRMMAGIKGKNTQPEVLIRKQLHRRGFRYKLHDRRLPGKPDLVLPRYRAVIQIHGCFWHLHDCALFKWPATRAGFWLRKLKRNREVDASNETLLLSQGWRVLTIWECSLKGKGKLSPDLLAGKVEAWILSSGKRLEIRGR